MNDRLTTALLAVALVSAGCLGTAGGPTATESPDPTPTPTATDDPGFDHATFEDGPKAQPDRPADLTESTVTEYVRTYEYRRVYNLLWMGDGTDVNLDCETHDVRSIDGGYDVLVSCTGYASGPSETDGTGTPVTVHADWFTQYFVYRVTDGGAERRRATEDERDDGTLGSAR